MTRTVAVVGAAGYVGGELLRLLIQHPHFELTGATSRTHKGTPVTRLHPNLRGATDLRFADPGNAEADTVLLAVPHTRGAHLAHEHLESGRRVIDLSADHRLADAHAYAQWYGTAHPHPEQLEHRVYGLPELHRDELPDAKLVSGVGCLATANNLALWPLARAGLLDDARLVLDTKIGSSAAGLDPGPGATHAERSRSLRLYAPTTHRHAAEIQQECRIPDAAQIHMTATSVELVRGAQAVCHILYDSPERVPSERELWQTWRQAYNDEPFVRIVREKKGIHRAPDPKLVAGSNYADVSFEPDPAGARIVATAAIDNLGKGAAGSAVQCLNLMHGLPETTALDHLPLHPV